MKQGYLGAGATEDSGKIGNCPHLRLLVASLVWDDGVLIGKFLAEYNLEALAYADVTEFLAHNVGQRAIETL